MLRSSPYQSWCGRHLRPGIWLSRGYYRKESEFGQADENGQGQPENRYQDALSHSRCQNLDSATTSEPLADNPRLG
ncbi:MAG: hypothetical protein ACPHL6_08680 [Rubripirellula sp.]